jgi:uncharacterized lipoprotein YddW (UPF0748 family)
MNNYFVWVEITANTQTILDEKCFREAMEKCAGVGIDSVILSIKDTSGFVLYNSSHAPHYSKYKDCFEEIDYLERCIRIVHECGMKLYASFDVFAEGNKKNRNPLMKGLTRDGWMCEVYGLDSEDRPVVQPIVSEHPIQTVGSIDDFGEIFVNPANDEVVDYELGLIKEVIENYDIDGFVLDRVRYVGLSADFSALTINKWKEAAKITEEVELSDIYRLEKENGELKIHYGKYFSSFNTFRAQMVHDFICKVRNVVDTAAKKVEFIDYTGSWYPEYYMVAANWASKEHVETSYPATDGEEYAKTGYIKQIDRMLSGFYYEDVTIAEAREHNQPADWYSVEGSADIAYEVTHRERPMIGSLYLFQYNPKPEDITRAVDMCFKTSDGCMLFDLCYLILNDWWSLVDRKNK